MRNAMVIHVACSNCTTTEATTMPPEAAVAAAVTTSRHVTNSRMQIPRHTKTQQSTYEKVYKYCFITWLTRRMEDGERKKKLYAKIKIRKLRLCGMRMVTKDYNYFNMRISDPII